MSEPTKTYRVFCLSRALSPITHTAGSEGNRSILARETVRSGGVNRKVPFISGNSIRHRMVREPIATHLVETCGLDGLTLPQLDFLFTGGSLRKGNGGRVNTRHAADLYRIMPAYRLLAGSLPSQIVPGCLIVERATLVCRENAERIGRLLPSGFVLPAGKLPAAASCVEDTQYTRRDFRDSHPRIAADAGPANGEPGRESTAMIFAGEAVAAGSLFVHGFIAQNTTPVEFGSLLYALGRWQEDGATLGGQAARGHGRLKLMATVECEGRLCSPDEFALHASLYLTHVANHVDECRAFLAAAFAEESAKPKRGKRGEPA